MRLPSKKRPGHPILAADWNLLIDALEARTPRPGPGMEIVSSTGGFTFRVKTNAPGGPPKPVPLAILGSRPPYIPQVAPLPPESPLKRFYIEWGTLNDQLASNWDAHFDIGDTTYFFAKAKLRTGSTLAVENWQIVTGTDYDTHKTADWPVGAPRPGEAVYMLGSVQFNEGAAYITNNGGGSLLVSEHLTEIRPGTGSGEVIYGKGLYFYRQTY